MENKAPYTINETEFTAKELAALAGVDPSRIRQLAGASVLVGRKRGGAWFIDAESARAWLEGRRGERGARESSG